MKSYVQVNYKQIINQTNSFSPLSAEAAESIMFDENLWLL